MQAVELHWQACSSLQCNLQCNLLCNEWIKIRTKHFLCCNLFTIYIKKINISLKSILIFTVQQEWLPCERVVLTKWPETGFQSRKKMLESRNKPWWITYHSEKLNKIQENRKFKDQNDQTVIGYIFHMWRKLYATLIGRIAFFTCEI